MARLLLVALLGCAAAASAAVCPSNHDLPAPPSETIANACTGKGNLFDRLSDAKVDVVAVYVRLPRLMDY